MLRKTASQIEIAKAELKYSVSDGAPWIEKQYTQKVTVHGYFKRIEQRTQCQNAHFQLYEL
jgi:hypothetical protein